MAEDRPLRWRAAFGATLAATMAMGSMALASASALAPMIVPDLGLTRTQLGSLATLAFAVAAAGSVTAGRQVDVFGGRRMVVWVFVAGGAAAATIALGQSLVWLWVGAFLCGAGQAVANPVTNQLIVDHAPVGRRGLLIGVKQSGVQMSYALVGFALPPLALLLGWRAAMWCAALLAILGVVAARVVIPAGHGAARPRAHGTRAPVEPMTWKLAAYAFTIGITLQAVFVYVPLYTFERVGLSVALAGLTTGVLGATGVIARIAWGRFAERRDSPMRALRVMAAVACVSVLLVLASEHVGPLALWPGLVGFGASATATPAVAMLAVVRAAGAGSTGRSTGIVMRGQYLGFLTGPVGLGAVVDRTGSYTIGWSAVAVLCVCALMITLAWGRRGATLRGEAGAGAA